MSVFKIKDGRTAFWQWDLDRQLLVGDEICGEVHFCNGTSDCSLKREVHELDGERLVDVPNVILQTARNFTVYGYVIDADGGYTKRAVMFSVRPRTKPADYVYTEDEVKTWNELNDRLSELEGDGLANAVAAYLEENPVEAGATAEEAQQIKENAQAVERLDQDKLDAAELPAAVNAALTQAKESGEFKGDPGPKGEKGEPGDDYVLTPEDKTEIAELAAEMVEVPGTAEMKPLTFTGAVNATYDGSEAVSVEIPTDDHINQLINTALGVIENGTY